MLKETKGKQYLDTVNKNDITKMTTIDNSNIIDQSGIMEQPKYFPLTRQDFNMAVVDNWTEIRAKRQPKRRCFHSSFIHENYLYIYGGIDIVSGKLSDMKKIKLDLESPEWEEIKPQGVTLEPLAYHAGCLYEKSYYILGGQGVDMKAVNYVYIYDIENNKLDKISPDENDFPALESHSVNLIDKSAIIFGGYTHGVYSNQVYSFDIESKSFRKLMEQSENNSSVPEGRVNHAALVHENSLYIFGGKNKDGVNLDDMWSYNLKTNTWAKIECNGEDRPAGRSGHSLILNGDHFVIFGGKSGMMKECNDLWTFDPKSNKFTLVHDTLIEKFTERELLEQGPQSEDPSHKNKSFRLLTKKDIPALNPLPKPEKNKEKKKKKEMMLKSQQIFEFRQGLEKELLKSPNTSKMKRSIIYNLDTDMTTVISKFSTIFHNTRMSKSVPNEISSVLGVPPTPRDGHSAFIYNNNLIVFGGDRNKFPLNDLFTFQF